MKWTISKALAYVQKHRKGCKYIIKHEDYNTFVDALRYVFEENAPIYFNYIEKVG